MKMIIMMNKVIDIELKGSMESNCFCFLQNLIGS